MDQRVKQVEQTFSKAEKETSQASEVEAEFQIYSDRQ